MDNDRALQEFQTAIDRNENENSDLIKLGLYLLESGDFEQRWQVTKLFPKLGEKIIDPLLVILENESIEVECRWFIARILSEFNDIKIIISFTRLLQTIEEEELLNILTEGLGKIGIYAINSLEILLQKDESSRLLAVKALAQIRHSDTIKALLKVIDDPSPEIRAIALECLGSFHQKKLIPIFIKALTDPVSTVRKEAVIALGMQSELIKKSNIIQHLKPLLYDINIDICQQTSLSLGRIKSDEAIEELGILLNKEKTPIKLKKTVIQALIWTESPKALTYLKQALFTENLEVCQIIINLLGTQKSEPIRHQVSQILVNFLSSNCLVSQELKIKQAVAVSLGELGGETAITCLQKLANDPNKSVKLHAIAGFKKAVNNISY
ncbi:HEAT repeat domain-containing protein [Crocosphaera chwakensis]|uniref:PBS lyase HEAT-like repeat n=1 Tax=Crocosphaera chwakensis CCY0110 TaxID=391612 RepID=A3ITJ2_9CHRO|nr:HEAT repeat domain-containing protein [Crocosphaera chwakensis]EAZ90173.1 PBS lyase HEAT-like repeat [Crocosphaera chwakensis CCY0110]